MYESRRKTVLDNKFLQISYAINIDISCVFHAISLKTYAQYHIIIVSLKTTDKLWENRDCCRHVVHNRICLQV